MTNSEAVLLNRFFGRNNFSEIIKHGKSKIYLDAILRYVDDAELKTNADCIAEVYDYLSNNYRDEYFYKNTLLCRYIPNRQDLSLITAMTEIPVGDSIADFMLAGEEGTAFEIKTEYDDLGKLRKQLADYQKAFEKTVIVTCEKHEKDALAMVSGTATGVDIMTAQGELQTVKPADQDRSRLSLDTMFQILRKYEYEEILKTLCGGLPKTNDFNHYGKCKAWFCKLPMDKVYPLFLRELQSRTTVDEGVYQNTPHSLKYIVYFSDYSRKSCKTLEKFLNSTFTDGGSYGR